MIKKFAITSGKGSSEFFDLNRTTDSMILVPPIIPKFAPASGCKLRRTSEWGH
jgi:hypothetical protein